MDNLSILIKALLEDKSVESIKSQIDEIQKYCDTKKLKLSLTIDNAEFKTFVANIEKVSTQLGSALDIKPDTSGLDALSNTYKVVTDEAGNEVELLNKRVKKLTDDTGVAVKETEKFAQKVDEFGNSITVLTDKERERTNNFKAAREEQEKLIDAMASGREKAEIKSRIEVRKEEFKQAQAINKSLDEQYEKQQKLNEIQHKQNIKDEVEYRKYLNEEQVAYADTYQKQLNEALGIKERIVLTDKQRFDYEQMILSYYEKQEKKLSDLNLFKQKMLGDGQFKGLLDIFDTKTHNKFKEQTDALRKNIKGISSDSENAIEDMKKISIQTQSLFKEASQPLGVFQRALENAFKFLRFYLVGGVLVRLIGQLKEVVTVVKETDVALTEINKILSLSTTQMRMLTEEATKLGQSYGRSTVEILNSVGAFAKAGLDKATSQQFAELTALLSNVGDISTEVAQKTLIMANAGYQLGNNYDALNLLISQFNTLANKTAIEVGFLAEGWQNAASIAKQAGIAIEDLNALLTVGGVISQKTGSEVANALRTFVMRLRGVSDGTDTLEEDISKVDSVLSKLGITIRETPTTFKPTMQIIDQIASKYRELGKAGQTVQQSEMLEALAGKYRANIISGILNNYDQVNKAIQDQVDALGSAEAENARYMDSIQARLKILRADFELFATKTLQSDTIKSIISVGSALIKFADSDLVRTTASLVLLTVSLDAAVKGATALSKSLGGFEMFDFTTGKLTILNSTTFWLTAIATAIYGIIRASKWFSEEAERSAAKIEKLQQEYEDYTSTLNDLEDRQKSVIARLNELYALRSNNKITAAEEAELNRLKDVNTELQKQIQYNEALKASAGYNMEIESVNKSNIATEVMPYNFYELGDEGRQGFAKWLLNAIAGGGDKATRLTVDEAVKANIDILNGLKEEIQAVKDAYDNGSISAEDYKEKISDLSKQSSVYTDNLDVLKQKLDDEKKAYLGLTDPGNNRKEQIEETTTSIMDAVIAFDKLINPSKYVDPFKPIASGVKKLADRVVYTQEQLEELYKTSEDSVKNFSSALKNLDSVHSELNKSERLSSETLSELIVQYPEYASQIASANQSKEDGIKITNLLMEIERERTLKDLENNKVRLEAELETHRLRVQMYDDWLSLMLTMPEEALLSSGDMSINALSRERVNEIQIQLDALSEGMKLVSSWQRSQEGTANDTYTATADVFRQLNIELERVNQSLTENQRLIDMSEGEEQNRLIEERVKLYGQQRTALLNLQKEQEKQLALRKQELSSMGFKFSGNDITNYATRLPQLTDEAAKNAEKLIAEFDDLAQKSLPNTVNQLGEIAKSIKDIGDTASESVKAQIEETFGQYYDYLFDNIEKEIKLIEESTDAYNEKADAIIEQLRNQIDLLEKVNEQEKEQEERAKRIADIEKQKQTIANLQNEKVRMFQNGEWVYVADPRKMREETEKLQEMQEDYASWEKDLNHKKQIEQLQQQISMVEQAKQIQNTANAERIAALQNFTEVQKELLEGQTIFEITNMVELNNALLGLDQSMYADRLTLLEQFLTDYNNLLGQSNTPFIANPTLDTQGFQGLNSSNFTNPVISSPVLPQFNIPKVAIPTTPGNAVQNHFHFNDLSITTPDAGNFIMQLEMIARSKK